MPIFLFFLPSSILPNIRRLVPILDSFTMSSGSGSMTDSVLIKANAFMNALNNVFLPLIASNITMESLTMGKPESRKLSKVLDKFPVLLEVFLHTALDNRYPEMVERVIGNLEAFCSSSSLELFTVPENVTADFQMIVSTLCRTNFTTVATELGDNIDFDRFMRIVSRWTFPLLYIFQLRTPGNLYIVYWYLAFVLCIGYCFRFTFIIREIYHT